MTDLRKKNGKIVFAAANAGYIHVALAPRCLVANLGKIRDRAVILETETRDVTPLQFAERILAFDPETVSFSVYIWNVSFIAETCKIIRAADPGIFLLAGGPQITTGDKRDEICNIVDAVIIGEGEEVIKSVLLDLPLSKERLTSGRAIEILAGDPDLAHVELPYSLYSDKDIASRIVYIETSRGCPFSCEYCSSSGSHGIRFFPLDKLFPEFIKLLDRGALHFKFLDRSFNSGGANSLAVLDFFIEHYQPGMTLHFEFNPEMPSEEWKKRLLAFPPKSLHLEVGIQTWNRDVAMRVKRPMIPEKITAALRFLVDEAKASVHADLIAGLPGESMESIADGFNRLAAFRPDELQFGILKNLPGTVIGRHSAVFDMRFSPVPPYEILSTSTVSFNDMRRLERFAKCWDHLNNRGRFGESLACLLKNSGKTPFDTVMEIADAMFVKYGRIHALSPRSMADAMREVCPPGRLSVLEASIQTDFRTADSRK